MENNSVRKKNCKINSHISDHIRIQPSITKDSVIKNSKLKINNSKNGFTVVELIVVALVIAILIKLLIPRYTRDAIIKYRVYTTAHAIASDLRYARQLSIGGGPSGNSGKFYWFKFYTVSTSTDTFRVFEDGSEANPIKSTTLGDNDIIISCSATDSFYFATSGAPVPTTGGTVSVQDAGNRYQWNVSVVKNTGRIQMSVVQF